METITNSQTFEIEKPHDIADVWNIPYGNENQKFKFKLTQKNFDESNPTWFSITLARKYSGIPNGDDLETNYLASCVSQSQEIVFDCTGPFNSWQGKQVLLLVDGLWKDPKNKNGFTLTIENQTPIGQIQKIDKRVEHIISDVVASRCVVTQPTRTANVVPYEGFRGSFKVVDYGNPKLSFYGIIVIVQHTKTELVEAIEFDNLKDFAVFGEADKTQFAIKLLQNCQRIILKRTQMTDQPFSFKSQFKGGKTVKALRGGAGGSGDQGFNYLTETEKLAVRPPIEKKEDKNALQIPKDTTKRSLSKGSGKTSGVSPKSGGKASPKSSGKPSSKGGRRPSVGRK